MWLGVDDDAVVVIVVAAAAAVVDGVDAKIIERNEVANQRLYWGF